MYTVEPESNCCAHRISWISEPPDGVAPAIEGAIGQIGTQNIVNQCYAGAADLCSRIERDADGVIFRVNNGYLNINQLKTSGLDIEASYRTTVGQGTLGLRVLASHVFELSTQVQGAAVVDRAGQTGLSGGIPSWNFNIDLNYRNGRFGVNINERIVRAADGPDQRAPSSRRMIAEKSSPPCPSAAKRS